MRLPSGQSTASARGVVIVYASLAAIGCGEAEPAPQVQDAAMGADAAVRMDAALQDASLDAGVNSELDAVVRTYAPLVDNTRWRRYDAAADPLASHQPAQIECFESATYVEYDSYEVDTVRCNYLLAQTGALREVPAGSELRVELLHYDLVASAPAETHVAILFGDELQWEHSIPIPSLANLVEAKFRSRTALGFQEPIRLHLHNHGANTYLLVALEVEDDATP